MRKTVWGISFWETSVSWIILIPAGFSKLLICTLHMGYLAGEFRKTVIILTWRLAFRVTFLYTKRTEAEVTNKQTNCMSEEANKQTSICLSVCLSVRLSVYLSVYLYVCLSVCLSICLSVCCYMHAFYYLQNTSFWVLVATGTPLMILKASDVWCKVIPMVVFGGKSLVCVNISEWIGAIEWILADVAHNFCLFSNPSFVSSITSCDPDLSMYRSSKFPISEIVIIDTSLLFYQFHPANS